MGMINLKYEWSGIKYNNCFYALKDGLSLVESLVP